MVTAHSPTSVIPAPYQSTGAGIQAVQLQPDFIDPRASLSSNIAEPGDDRERAVT